MKLYRKLFIIFALSFSTVGMHAQDNTQLPKGLTPELAEKIKAMLPKGATLEMFLSKLPEGMSIEQALKMMAAQQQAKAQEAQAQQQTQQASKTGGWKILPYGAVNLGMTSSIGTPKETRSVEASDYNFNFAVGGIVTKRFSSKFGVLTGLAFERKGSNSNVIMKDYFTKVHFDGQEEETQGYFSGRSQGWHDCYYLTLPLNIMYEPNDKWEVHFGPYFGYTLSRDRHGLTSEGTIRQSVFSPLIPVDHSESDNSNKVSHYDWGLQAGCTRQMWRQLYLVFDFSWGLHNVWDGREYGMKKPIYNVYAKLGFGWKFDTEKKRK